MTLLPLAGQRQAYGKNCKCFSPHQTSIRLNTIVLKQHVVILLRDGVIVQFVQVFQRGSCGHSYVEMFSSIRELCHFAKYYGWTFPGYISANAYSWHIVISLSSVTWPAASLKTPRLPQRVIDMSKIFVSTTGVNSSAKPIQSPIKLQGCSQKPDHLIQVGCVNHFKAKY